MRERDAARYREALERLPLPDSPTANRFICELVGQVEADGEFVEVCTLPDPKTVDRSGLITDEDLERIAALPKPERYKALWDLFRSLGLLQCHTEYHRGQIEDVYWCRWVSLPEAPAGPGPISTKLGS